MDWQETVALTIVAATAGIFLWRKIRPRKFSFERDTHCGCPSPSQSSPKNSIVIQGRRGESPKVTVKMK